MSALALSSGRTAPHPVHNVDAAGIKELLAQHEGKVILLNFWATWCPPCLVEFPDIVALEKAYRDRGLVVISVSADPPERVEDDLVPFLQKEQPGFPVYVRKREDPEKLIRAIDPHWTGKIPATFFYDHKGEPSVKRYSQMTREELVKIVTYLLGE
jgi:thiol-disulfide isomerase/thioredoxin